MSLLYWLRRLYSLDTLDTRFTVPANTPLKAAADTRSSSSPSAAADPSAKDARSSEIAHGASPSRWKTPEYFVYYLVFLTLVPLMFKTVIGVSQGWYLYNETCIVLPDVTDKFAESHPTYPTYSHLLSPGWIPGRKVDNSDAQYSSFRDNIPYLFALLVFHPLLRRVHDYFLPVQAQSEGPKASITAAAADARLKQRTYFDYYFALVFIVALHGISAAKILLILYLNYKIAKDLPRSYIPAATWIFNLGVLFANELCDGYPLGSIAKVLTSVDTWSPGQEPRLVAWAQWLDGLGGLMPRWQILFKVTVLRMISFNMDYYWSLDYRSSSPIEKKQLDPASLSERDRVAIPADQASFNPLYYVAYVLYSPLYLTGPILTFNDYISQQRYPSPAVTPIRTLLYGIRFCLTLLCMEVVLHYIYAVAISKATTDWSQYTPGQLSMLGFFNLHIIWLKLLIPWRFFRLWALLDGMDPPENMVRCMSNNYSAFAFWRAWHRSFNRWIVRYLYVPLGGGGRRHSSGNTILSQARRIFNALTVFTFVAVWHDINLRLLMWGWLITLFVLPEVVASMLFPPHRWRSRPNAYRVLCGIGAVGNILMMMIANLVGFALGLDGLKGLLAGIVGSWSGVAFLLSSCLALFVGVQVMFEVRESERRKGIVLKY